MRRICLLAVALAVTAVGLAGCQPKPPDPWTPPPGLWVEPVFSVERFDDFAYATVRDEHGQMETLRLDVYAPKGDPRAKRPLVVWAHGGSFTSGSKASMRWIPEALAARGYVVASIDYRLNEGLGAVRFPLSTQELIAIISAKEDMQGAVRWLRANAALFRIDGDEVAVAGYSAGAVMALITATTADVPGHSGTPGQSSMVCTAVSVSGAGTSLFVDPSDAGALYLHGAKDTTVPYAEATKTHDAMVAAGLPTKLVTFPDTAHGVPASHPDQIIAEMAAWLRAQVVDRTVPCR
jgi:dipeptidyl aminopeptidase/acylaminoacyl peptidase